MFKGIQDNFEKITDILKVFFLFKICLVFYLVAGTFKVGKIVPNQFVTFIYKPKLIAQINVVIN